MKFIKVLAAASVALSLTFSQTSFGVIHPAHERLPDFDQRMKLRPGNESTIATQENARSTAAAELQTQIPAAQVDFHEITGSPAWIDAGAGLLSPGTAGGDTQGGGGVRARCRDSGIESTPRASKQSDRAGRAA